MRFLDDTELRDSRSAVWQALEAGDAVALVTDGQLRALVLPIEDGDVEGALDYADRMRAARALARIQAESVRRGLDKMTDEEINAEVAAARAERRARRGE